MLKNFNPIFGGQNILNQPSGNMSLNIGGSQSKHMQDLLQTPKTFYKNDRLSQTVVFSPDNKFQTPINRINGIYIFIYKIRKCDKP